MDKQIITWDQYFMGVAKLSAYRSKDPNTQVGACIVNSDNRIVGVGYNGLPRGCEDDKFPWSVREGALYDTKYPYVVHAEPMRFLTLLRNCRVVAFMFLYSHVMSVQKQSFKVESKKLSMKMKNIKDQKAIEQLNVC